MALKLKSLLEGYAWERKADGSLPTLKDSIAVHEANKAKKEPRWQDNDGDGKWYEPEDLNEYGEDEFDRNPEMYGGGKSSREYAGIPSELVEKIEDCVERLMQNLSTNSNVPNAEKTMILKELVKISDLIDTLQDEL
ncbi:hypothetical protein UFOVP723_133 [uncultured Caudovirales phage]|uniref:Uncharacterized protein n=1 Tax=uncultured Caudovirales phage TaxID=2100421 RepID=A0A6J5NNJ9_9CAUD|nr:hypothetical protein UFOVP723_133 [uncultured Caudovirales phage]